MSSNVSCPVGVTPDMSLIKSVCNRVLCLCFIKSKELDDIDPNVSYDADT